MAQKLQTPSAEEQILTLQLRLQEAEDTLSAIRMGAIDALVISGPNDRAVYTLKSADYTYRMLIESMNQGALTVSFDGTILYSNRQFSTMLRTPLEQIIGSDILSFIVPEDQIRIKNLIQASPQADQTIEVCLLTARKRTLTVIAAINTVTSEDMDPYLCVVVTDMTERKRAEIAKDEFISLASHQLRTPATSVKQYINMVIDGLFGPLNEEQMQALQKANTSNDRELKIVEDLLRVAQIDAGKVILSMQSANLTKLLADVIAEQSAQCQIRDQKLSFIAAKQPVFARIDSNLMRMVAENLIDNASKYMVEGGTIAISVESKANKAIFRVIDEGVGIAKADTPKLFQKFSRLPNELSVKVGGNGLGLYWVKKVIDLHKAQIDVSSRIGRGTTFTVTLPQGEKFAKDISR